MYCKTSNSASCENHGFPPSHHLFSALSKNDRGWKDRSSFTRKCRRSKKRNSAYWEHDLVILLSYNGVSDPSKMMICENSVLAMQVIASTVHQSLWNHSRCQLFPEPQMSVGSQIHFTSIALTHSQLFFKKTLSLIYSFIHLLCGNMAEKPIGYISTNATTLRLEIIIFFVLSKVDMNTGI